MADDDQRLRDSQREYLDFLDDEVCIQNSMLYFSLHVMSISLHVIVGRSKHLHVACERYDC